MIGINRSYEWMQAMDNETKTKIHFLLQQLAVKAAGQTIDERGYWGLAEIRIIPNLQSFSSTAEQKYQIKIVSSSKNILESREDSEDYETADAEPYYGTDWVVVCSMHGTLRELFESYGLDPQFEFDIEHDENRYFVVEDKNKLKIHTAHHDFISPIKLTDIQIDALHEQVTKLTFFSLVGG